MNFRSLLSVRHDWFFDCDGVILDSNEEKTSAFADVARAYGDDAADAMTAYHTSHGGISRFVKWRHFFDAILERAPEPGEYERVLDEFAQRSRARVLEARADPAVADLVLGLRAAGHSCHVVSGAAQDELRDVFRTRGLADLFDSVNGSPATKLEIVDALRSDPDASGVFVGDSALDHEVALAKGLAFVFVSHWTEFDGGMERFEGADATVVQDLSELSNHLFGA